MCRWMQNAAMAPCLRRWSYSPVKPDLNPCCTVELPEVRGRASELLQFSRKAVLSCSCIYINPRMMVSVFGVCLLPYSIENRQWVEHYVVQLNELNMKPDAFLDTTSDSCKSQRVLNLGLRPPWPLQCVHCHWHKCFRMCKTRTSSFLTKK